MYLDTKIICTLETDLKLLKIKQTAETEQTSSDITALSAQII